ncbi:MAG: hypothetical protein WC939_00730 [Acholeplasmataceae bacterium]
MKTKNIVFPLILSLVMAILLFVLKQNTAAIIALTFSLIMLMTLLGLVYYNHKQKKRQDKRFGIYTKENIIMEYNKLITLKDNQKLKAVCMLYIKPVGKYTNDDIKSFSSYLKKKFSIDPVGYDEGIVIILANIHELLLEEMLKQIKQELIDHKIPIHFNYGIDYYTGNETYETLIENIRKVVK